MSCGKTTVSWLTTVTAAHRSACCRLRALKVSLPLPPFFFSLAEQLKKDKAKIFPQCHILPPPAWCRKEWGREEEKSSWTIMTLVSPNCSWVQERLGLQNTEAGGGRAVKLSCTSLQNSCCSIWFLFLSPKVLFAVGIEFYKCSVFIILLEWISYAELRSIKWKKKKKKPPKDKRNAESRAFQNKHSTPCRGTGTVCAWLLNRGSCTSSNFVCIL